MTKEIITKKGHIILVDDDDYPELSKHRWTVNRKGYAGRCTTAGGKQIYITMHRLIANAQPGVKVDHIDRNTLNNTRSNLRPASDSQSNAHRRACGSSQFKGLYHVRGTNKWQALITKDGKRRYLGRYASEEAAARAYDAAARQYHGEFALLNFPNEA